MMRISNALNGLCFSLIIAMSSCAGPQLNRPVLTLADGVFDPADPETLGLASAPGTETFTVFRPEADENTYNHGVVLFPFRGRLYAQWQSSRRDEDAPETDVRYAVSEDGETWSEPRILAPQQTSGIVTSGGWWSDGQTLVAYTNIWPEAVGDDKYGYAEYRTSTDGEAWSEPARITTPDGAPVDAIIEQDPKALPSGRIVTAFHVSPGLHAKPGFTDDPLGITGWTIGDMKNLPTPGSISRELEPSWYQRRDGALVMLFRDQESSFQTLAAISHDQGKTWTRPELFAFPDSRSKQSAGNLPDESAYRVNNPVSNKSRFPLVVTVSGDGFVFEKAWLLRAGGDDLQPMRYEGKYKRPSYSYPKSVVWNEYLYVGYATNKEDVQVTRVPWRALMPAK